MVTVVQGIKLSPEKDYMTKNEHYVMDKMLKDGTLTFFRLKKCERKKCENFIIKNKKYCSLKCKKKVRRKKK